MSYWHTFSKRILIVGIVPPPHGGVSLHIQRVVRLMHLGGAEISLWDIIDAQQSISRSKYVYKFVKELWFVRPEEVHFHVLPMRRIPIEFMLLALYRFFFPKTIFKHIEHSDRFYYGRSWWYRKMISVFSRMLTHQIFIGEKVYSVFKNQGYYITANYSIESPYIAPDLQSESSIISGYRKNLMDFVQACSPLLVVNASKFTLWDNQDVYGLDLALTVMERLSLDFSSLGIVFAVSTIENQAYYKSFLRQLTVTNANHFLLLSCDQEIWPLFRMADLTLRPSRHDTFGISVQESLDGGTPVIASDVCKRPEGSILFKTGDTDDLYAKCYTEIKKLGFTKDVTKNGCGVAHTKSSQRSL